MVFNEDKWARLSKGTTFDSVSSDEVSSFRLVVPKDPSEKESIAEVLSNMDDEITVLEAQLDKAKQIKQAMMQELLTGRIRLV